MKNRLPEIGAVQALWVSQLQVSLVGMEQCPHSTAKDARLQAKADPTAGLSLEESWPPTLYVLRGLGQVTLPLCFLLMLVRITGLSIVVGRYTEQRVNHPARGGCSVNDSVCLASPCLQGGLPAGVIYGTKISQYLLHVCRVPARWS